MEIGVYAALEQHPGALFQLSPSAWVGALVADLVINKPLGLQPAVHRVQARASLRHQSGRRRRDAASRWSCRCSAYLGLFGPLAKALSPFVALVAAFVAAPLIAWATERPLLPRAQAAHRSWANSKSIRCTICENAFEPEDMAYCPAYAGPICSLCCSLDARCHDGCKPQARAIGTDRDDAGCAVADIGDRRRGSIRGSASISACSRCSASTLGLILLCIYVRLVAQRRLERRHPQRILEGVLRADDHRRRRPPGCSCWRSESRRAARGGNPAPDRRC